MESSESLQSLADAVIDQGGFWTTLGWGATISMKKYARTPFDRYMNSIGSRVNRDADFVARVSVDFSAVHKARAELNPPDADVSLAAILIKAASISLSAYPLMRQVPGNRSYWIPEIVRIAVPVDSALSDAYAVPVVFENAHEKSLTELTTDLRLRGDAIRNGEIGPFAFLKRIPSWVPVELLGLAVAVAARLSPTTNAMTFCIPVLTIVPALDEFHLARISGGPVISIGDVHRGANSRSRSYGDAIKSLGTVTCSVDHRVCNGRYAGQFLNRFREALERELVDELVTLSFPTMGKRTTLPHCQTSTVDPGSAC